MKRSKRKRKRLWIRIARKRSWTVSDKLGKQKGIMVKKPVAG